MRGVGDAEVVAQRAHAVMRSVRSSAGARDRIGDRAQRQVRGRQRDADDVVGQHHHHLAPGLPASSSVVPV